MSSNVDDATVASFGEEWSTFDQGRRDPDDLQQSFDRYFELFPWADLPDGARGFDAGCGSGRWARLVAPRVGSLVALDPSKDALSVAAGMLGDLPQVQLLAAAAGDLPFADASMDFGYSLGVLHHTPDPARGLRDCVRCLRPGAPFLVYLYYALDNRPPWFRAIWRASDALRRLIASRRPRTRLRVTTVIAAVVYWPVARGATLLGRRGHHVPLAAYGDKPFHVMRTDAYDRFATPVEHRYTRAEVVALLEGAGLRHVRVRNGVPYWCAVGIRS